MSKMIAIRFNADESELLQRFFERSGDAGLSTHIKRVYFDAMRPDVPSLNGVLAELENLNERIAEMQRASADDPMPEPDSQATRRHNAAKSVREVGDSVENSTSDPQLTLSILCGLYVMVRKSVGESIRSQADQMLDASAIEAYLRGP